MNGENWEGAKVSKAKIDGDSPQLISLAYSATRDGCRVAALGGNIVDGFAVRVDGKEGPRYEDIREETPVFSANGLAIAYCAQKDGKWRWVIDGVEGPEFQTLTATSFDFSADGKRHAYVAALDFGTPNVLIVDGKIVAGGEAGKPIPWDAAPLFSPDGRRLAYVEAVEAERKLRVVLDNKPGRWTNVQMRLSSGFGATKGKDISPAKPAEFGLDFSADSKHFAYSEELPNGSSRRVIDGEPQPIHKELGIDFAFAPDGSDYAYMAYPDGQRAIVRKTLNPFPIETIANGSLTFSPDGKHLAFSGMRYGKWAIWKDGEAIPVDMQISEIEPPRVPVGRPRFSPDSKRIAYWAQGPANPLGVWVVDGKPSLGTEGITENSFSFSPDSAHYCYYFSLGRGKDYGIVVDGELRATHPSVQCLVFRNDGSLEYLASNEDAHLFRFRITGY